MAEPNAVSDRSDAQQRTWVAAAVAAIEADANRSADTHLIRFPLRATPGVHWVRDLHLWSLGDGSPAMSAHVAIGEMAEWPAILAQIRVTMEERHGIRHLTLQPETENLEELLRLQEAQCRRRA